MYIVNFSDLCKPAQYVPNSYISKDYEADDEGPPSMAPPPLPQDYGGQSNAQNDIMDMGWTMPTSGATQGNAAKASMDDDWGNAGWGFSGGSAADNKPPENNNFQQAGGNTQTSGLNNDFSSSKAPNTAANTNQVTFFKACVVLLSFFNFFHTSVQSIFLFFVLCS